MKDLPEARASVTYSLTSPKGFPILFTLRSEDEVELFTLMDKTEKQLVEKGYLAERRPGTVKPAPVIVEGEKCPKCGSPIVKLTAKGRPAIKCSTAKFDFTTKTASGCDFFKYTDQIEEPATPKQVDILKSKNLWEEGMTKSQASGKISEVLGK